MVREKILRKPEYREIVYSEKQWKILRELRKEAINILETLAKRGIQGLVHGSIARGDVWEGSDIDVFIPYTVPSYIIEYTLESAGYRIYARYIVIATPSSTPKAYIVLDEYERKNISFPLAKLKPREYEFYKFGGILDLKGLKENRRVPGVDKRLVLIEPTKNGHRESPVMGYENIVAEKLGISIDTVLERVRVLSRRDKIGRTGVFVKYELSPEEVFEEALEKIMRRNPLVRRALKDRF
ncbi:DNA polymerase, beta domain protein region [Staphylothermus marinus F1]|uniref:protein adenylyltransferase n=1 Tax=Staphylothermus marinus (strain ATCC 43588 / DSM 3639 / JCM 9404 / F1) TaxID=399550 RepID=A3DMX6_STAMF|nr:nucleotidyltransferase domain-containing protein [Staphylothermus marinus]ABN69986.1 DNA polymerase, beta domain protein region [Staphylothermus marinus F1]